MCQYIQYVYVFICYANRCPQQKTFQDGTYDPRVSNDHDMQTVQRQFITLWYRNLSVQVFYTLQFAMLMLNNHVVFPNQLNTYSCKCHNNCFTKNFSISGECGMKMTQSVTEVSFGGNAAPCHLDCANQPYVKIPRTLAPASIPIILAMTLIYLVLVE
jgi:hypothetical protein